MQLFQNIQCTCSFHFFTFSTSRYSCTRTQSENNYKNTILTSLLVAIVTHSPSVVVAAAAAASFQVQQPIF